jgi:hypothetical protein
MDLRVALFVCGLGLAVAGAMRVLPAPHPLPPSPIERDVRTSDLDPNNVVPRPAAFGNGVEKTDDGVELVAVPGGAVSFDVPDLKADDFQATLVAWFISGAGALQFHFHVTPKGGDAVVVFSDGRLGGLGEGSVRSFNAGGPLEALAGVPRVDLPADELTTPFILRVKSERHRVGGLINQRGFAFGTYPYAGTFGVKVTPEPGAREPVRVRLDWLRVVAPYP